jgi:subtilisin family serine protease
VHRALAETAARSQTDVRAFLRRRGAKVRPFFIVNALRVEADQATIEALEQRPDVARVLPDRTYSIPPVQPGSPLGFVTATEWGLDSIRAPEAWDAFGVKGEGIVVANVDTGVQFDHPALIAQYRGTLDGGAFDHNYNWYDPSSVCGSPSDEPCDNAGHGTHTMGTMVGGDGLGPFVNDIGVAPGAKWIAAKGCESSSCSNSALIASAQWITCPTRTDGVSDPDCSKAPDIVNNSWGGGRGDPWYFTQTQAWRAAGIIPVFSIGNSGSSCSSANSPGDYPNVIGVGATTINDVLASFSSKGPGTFRPLKPDFAAPGDNVRSSTNSSNTSYGLLSGTSMAAPHVVGSIALLLSANPTFTYGMVYNQLRLTTNTALGAPPGPDVCGNRSYDVYPNFIYGWGQVDAAAALGL